MATAEGEPQPAEVAERQRKERARRQAQRAVTLSELGTAAPALAVELLRHAAADAAAEHGDKRTKAIASAGGIAAVVAGMGGHAGSADVQECGCRALANLAADNEENSKAIASAGGIAAVVAGMGGHAGSAEVQDDSRRWRSERMERKRDCAIKCCATLPV
eukprot:COSAG02_NODE_6305_length_3665_cov_126.598990_1_plen_161_part_00